MSTASETKSAGVPAGATHVCTKCGQYFRFDEKEWSRRMLGAERDGGCVCDDLRPIAEAGPAPTTAAPAERPVGTCDASSLEHAKNPDCQNHRPAEQLSGKVVCDALPGKPHAEHCHPGWCINPRPAEQPGKAADPRPEVLCDKPSYKHGGSHPQKATCVDPRPAQPQAPAEPTQKQIEKARAFIRHHNDATCVDACAAELARLLAAEAAPLREERDRLARVLEAMRRERNGAQSQRDQERARAETAEKAVAARDARIATLVDAVTKAADTFKDLGFVFRMLRNPKAEEACNLAEKHTRAALGAPEGQPPAPQRYLGNDVTCSAATVAAPQELLGKEGAKPDRPDLRTLIAQLLGVVELAECENCGTMYGEDGGCVECAGVHSAVVDAREAMKDPPASAPPRKAPQEDAAAKLASVREYVAYMFDPASLDELHMRGTFAAGVWKCIRPSSPEEQLSGKELK